MIMFKFAKTVSHYQSFRIWVNYDGSNFAGENHPQMARYFRVSFSLVYEFMAYD